MIYLPEYDGKDHINIFSRAKTELGRWMSNFAYAPLVSEKYGQFVSIEGFWYWLKTGKKYDILRTLHGAQAKGMGRSFEVQPMDENEFKREILLMINQKVRTYNEMRRQLQNCHLPFAHYYVYNGQIKQAGFEWITEHWDRIRNRLREQPKIEIAKPDAGFKRYHWHDHSKGGR